MGRLKSFSLLELLVAVTIFAVALLITIAISANVFSNRYKTDYIVSVQQNAQKIVQLVSSQVNLANSCGSFSDPQDTTISIYYLGFSAQPDVVDLSKPLIASKLVSSHYDSYSQKIFYSIYAKGQDLYLNQYFIGETLRNVTRKINDSSVKIDSIKFTTVNTYRSEPTAGQNKCETIDYQPTKQSSLLLELIISSSSLNPREQYQMKIVKFISGKNFDYLKR